jgi:SPP1 family predicted phage head-tail adaptor
MNVNYLNKNIGFEFYDVSTNSLGTPIENWTFLKESYANVRLLNGDTAVGDGDSAFTTLEFTVRYDEDINYKCRIIYEHQPYAIKHIWTEGRLDWTKIRAKVWEE